MNLNLSEDQLALQDTLRRFAAKEYGFAKRRALVAEQSARGYLPLAWKQLAELGVDYIGVHTGTDDQAHGANPLADLAAVSQAVNTPVVVAGGITPASIRPVLAYHPAIVIVGSAVTAAKDPAQVLRELRNLGI